MKIIENLTFFFIGFNLGLTIEILAIILYLLIDPDKDNNIKLFSVIIIQLLLLFYIMEEFHVTKNAYMLIGVITSQTFLFDYAIHLMIKNINKN